MGWSLRDVATFLVWVLGSVGVAWVILWLPFVPGVLLGAAVVSTVTAYFGLAWGGAVVGVVVWLIPVLALTLVLVLWPSTAVGLVMAAVLFWPVAGWFFTPVGRAHAWYIERLGGWVLGHSLSGTDRRARMRLQSAERGTPRLRADSVRLDDLPRTLAALRQHADNILAVAHRTSAGPG